MSAPTCVRCARPTPDGYACSNCAGRAVGHLKELADLVPAARDVAHGQSRRGPAVAGGSGARLELNLTAQARLDAITNTLTTWARAISEERGIEIKEAA